LQWTGNRRGVVIAFFVYKRKHCHYSGHMINTLHLVWNLIRGGTEGQCARVAIELASRGLKQKVMVFRREGYFLPIVEEATGPVADIGIRGMARPGTAAAIMRLAYKIRKERINILHAWDADAAIFGQFAAALAGIHLITSRRDLGQIYPPHKVWLMRRADRRAKVIVANASAIVDEFVRQGTPHEKFRVIPNILNVTETDMLSSLDFSRITELPPGELVVMVARLDPEKDIPTFIYAAERILRLHPKASFLIAGDGVERNRLEILARHHQLNNRLVFLGEVLEIPSLLKHCSVGVLTPSRNEGLSNTILEYMAAGLPVIATDCGGNRELVQPPHGGVIVPVGDADALANAVVDYLRKPALRKLAGDFNRRQVLECHQPDRVGDQFEELYREVIKK